MPSLDHDKQDLLEWSNFATHLTEVATLRKNGENTTNRHHKS